jgi:hypothetical protein
MAELTQEHMNAMNQLCCSWDPSDGCGGGVVKGVLERVCFMSMRTCHVGGAAR